MQSMTTRNLYEISYRIIGLSRYEPFVVVENEYIEDMMVSVLIWSKAGFAKGIQGTESLVVGLSAKCTGCPSRDRSPGSNRG